MTLGAIMRAFTSFAFMALLVACSPSAPEQNGAAAPVVAGQAPKAETPPPLSDESELVILLRGDGLSVETPGHGSPLRFGSTTPDVAAGALSALGEPKRSLSNAGSLRYR